jgi:hypothetical protein
MDPPLPAKFFNLKFASQIPRASVRTLSHLGFCFSRKLDSFLFLALYHHHLQHQEVLLLFCRVSERSPSPPFATTTTTTMRTRRENKQGARYCTQFTLNFHAKKESRKKTKKKKTAEITGFIRITTRELK